MYLINIHLFYSVEVFHKQNSKKNTTGLCLNLQILAGCSLINSYAAHIKG